MSTYKVCNYYVQDYCTISGMYTLVELDTLEAWSKTLISCFSDTPMAVESEVVGYLRMTPDKHLLGNYDFPEFVLMENIQTHT